MQEHMFMSRIESILSTPIHKAVGAFFLALFAPVAPAMVGLFVLVGIDLIFGAALAIKNNNFSSVRLRSGLSKFMMYPVAIMVVRLGEQQILFAFGKDINYIASFLILYLAITEMVSVLETLAKFGVKIPSPILIFFKKQIETDKIPGK